MILVQVIFASLLIVPMLWGIVNWYKYKGVAAPKIAIKYPAMINSAVFFALAFNIIFFLQEVFLVLGKKALGLQAFLYHNNHTWVGEHPMALLMQGSGALAIFLIGIICMVVYQFIRNSRSIWKLFILWLAFHGLVQSIPQVIIGYLSPGTDVGEALVGYLNLSDLFLIILYCNPAIVVAKVSIVREMARAWLVLEVNNPMCVVRSRINHVSDDLFDRSILFVTAVANDIIRK